MFVILFYIGAEKLAHYGSSFHSGVVPEVEQQPQFKCGVGDRQFDGIVACHLDCRGNIGMVIDIENRPYRVEFDVVVFFSHCFLLGLVLAISRNGNDG